MNFVSALISTITSACIPIHILLILCTPAILSQKSDSYSQFDWALAKEVSATGNDNVILSPISLKLVLAMLYQGANGNSSAQLESALGLQKYERAMTNLHFSTILRMLRLSDSDNELDIGNKIFVDVKTHLNDFFNESLVRNFNTSIEKVDFSNPAAAVRAINQWASNVTRGNINELLSQSEAKESTLLLLLNALYFKGQWDQPFPTNQTRDGYFRLSSTKGVPVKYMNSLQTHKFAESFELEASILRLPYVGEKFAMYIVMPVSADGVNKLFERVTAESIEAAIQNMDDAELNLSIPLFKFDHTCSMKSALEKLGIQDIFNEKADLSGITKGQTDHLLVSDVIQKAGIEVNEKGSAAYVTTQADLVSKFGDHVTFFTVDRPFMFFIKDERSNTILFVGKVANPGLPGAEIIDYKDPKRPVIVKPAMYPGIHYQPDVRPQAQESTNSVNNEPSRFGSPNTVNRKPLVEHTSNILPETNSPNNDTSSGSSSSGFSPPDSGYYMPNGDYVKQNFDQERFSFFDTELLLKMCAMDKKSNLVMSPASVKTVLSMIYEGAAEDTEKELTAILRLPKNRTRALRTLHAVQKELHSPSGPQVRWLMASRLLTSSKLPPLPEYKQTIKQKYHAEVDVAKFESAAETSNNINNWINDVTNGFIPTLVSPDLISKDAQLIMLNAVYFKGDWLHPFNRKFSQTGCFYPEPKQCKEVNMMTQRAFFKYGYYKQLLAHVLELPYADLRYSMVIVLPSNEAGLEDLLKDLPLCPILPFLNDIVSAEVQLTMPSFKVELSQDLTSTIASMGASSAFSDKADLRYMLGQRRAKITKIVHKAKIIVNEKGTEAGAGTAGVIVPLMNTQLIQLSINQPFLYFIRDLKSGFIFSGRIYDPSL